MPVPIVIVKFYENFRFEEVDVHGLFVNLGSGTEVRTFLVKEEVFNPGLVETNEYEENIKVGYTSIILRVEASGGTWKVKLHELTEATDFETAPISYLFDAAVIRAAIPVEELGNDPGKLHLLRTTIVGGGSSDEGGDPVFATFADRPDLGENAVEMRIFTDSGLLGPAHDATAQGKDINLGPIWVMVPAWDEIDYRLELEEGPCGKANIVVPEGIARAEGARSGRGQVRRIVGGNRA